MNLTTPVKKQKPEFRTKHIPKHEVWILPLFVLCGLKGKSPDIVDTYTTAELFTPHDDPNEISKISDEIRRFAIISAPEESEEFLAVITAGAERFKEPFQLEYFNEENSKLVEKYEFDEFSISKYLFHGRKEKNWYPHTLKAFKEQFKEYDIELFVKLFAITSPRNNFKANLVHAKHAYSLFKKGKRFEKQGFLPSVVTILNDFRSGEFTFEKDSRNGRRKITNFANAILGDKKAVVVDSWVMRAFGLAEEYSWKDVKKAPHTPRITEYDLVENYIRTLAEVSCYEPRQIVSMLWSGTRSFNSNHKVARTRKVLERIS